ncbi:MAG: transcription factor [Crenarchaeota archaeon]|nr:transcription factor [Thermoproteota archaeon]
MIERLVDQDARKVFEALLEEGKELSEYDIMDKTGLRGSVVRRSLNILAEKGFVTYRRVKHPEKGRIIFYWSINYDGIPAIIEARKRAALEKLRALLQKEEENTYYVCPLDGTRYTFEEALEYEFTCPRCGSMLEPDEDREIRLEILRRYVSMLEADISGAGSG